MIRSGINKKMPYSYTLWDSATLQYIDKNYQKNISILDVGPGEGKYSRLLHQYKNIDGVEIYQKYIVQFGLVDKYRKVFNMDIMNFNEFGNYSLVIMGDILEHLTIDDTKKLLNNILMTSDLIVQIPYEYEQGEYDGNVHETHLQPELTYELFLSRYSEFNFQYIVGGNEGGVFVTKSRI